MKTNKRGAMGAREISPYLHRSRVYLPRHPVLIAGSRLVFGLLLPLAVTCLNRMLPTKLTMQPPPAAGTPRPTHNHLQNRHTTYHGRFYCMTQIPHNATSPDYPYEFTCIDAVSLWVITSPPSLSPSHRLNPSSADGTLVASPLAPAASASPAPMRLPTTALSAATPDVSSAAFTSRILAPPPTDGGVESVAGASMDACCKRVHPTLACWALGVVLHPNTSR